jgi:hypothetical protein
MILPSCLLRHCSNEGLAEARRRLVALPRQGPLLRAGLGVAHGPPVTHLRHVAVIHAITSSAGAASGASGEATLRSTEAS